MKRRATLLLTTITAAVAALVVALVLLAGARPAQAAFPGFNGKVFFDSDRSILSGDPSTTDSEIFAMNENGTGLTQLTKNAANDRLPAVSSDGFEVVFASDRGGNFEIYKMDVADTNNDGNGDNLVRLTNNAALDIDPAWSPDGTKIAFMSFREGNQNIYVMDAVDINNDGSGDNLVRLTKKPAFDGNPAWSPNGEKIAFTSDRSGNFEVHVMKPRPESRRNRPLNLSKHRGLDAGPDWSPNGTQIAFVSTRSGAGFQIHKMAANGANKTRLTENAHQPAEGPAWSPDGTKIAFHDRRNNANGDIFVMDANGNNEVNRTNDAAFDGYPSWQPSGAVSPG